MASGVERSKFIRPMADALGWTTGRLRALFVRADYHSPFVDLQRALRILQANVPNQMATVFKALNIDPAYLHSDRPNDPAASQQLALMPPAAQTSSPVTPNVPAVSTVAKGLVDQLAQMIPGDDALTNKREKVRSILKKHGVDGRMKDKALAIVWLRKVFPGAGEGHIPSTVIEVESDIETLPAERLRPLIKSLMAELAEKDRQLKLIQTRFGEVNYFLDATKHKMVGDGLLDVTEEQALFFLARAAAKKQL